MKESIGYTVTLNIIIVFITIVIGFICASIIYFKSNKISNVITNAIEKYEGYNQLSVNEISNSLETLGYGSHAITCASTANDKGVKNGKCLLTLNNNGRGTLGYCVYECFEENEEYYYYKIRTNMMVSIPIIHDILDIPIYSNTNRMYDFRK